MGDGLDDLLNEVENALGSTSTTAPRRTSTPSSTSYTRPPSTVTSVPASFMSNGSARPPSIPTTSSKRGEIDDLLDIVADDSSPALLSHGPRASATGRSSAEPYIPVGDGRKCTTVHIGVSNSSATRRSCPALRCTNCDFPVHQYSGQWQADVDYMFFRNYMPAHEKLKTKLTRADGAVALCCQCSWATFLPSDGMVVVRKSSGLATPLPAAMADRVGGSGWGGWVCAGHEPS